MKRINRKVDEVSEKEKEVIEFREYLDKIKLLDDTVEEDNIINDYLLDNITSRMPENVFFHIH